MAAFQIKKATRSAAKLRIGIAGPSGSGKTYTALRVASLLGKRVGVIDTERGSASLYADETPDGQPLAYDVIELDTFGPELYVNAIKAFEDGAYDVIVIDSLTHAWAGVDGMLERKDKAGAGFDSWKTITPQHTRLVDSILRSKCHVILTARTKTEYVIEKDARGKSVPRKVGVAPVFRDGIEYETTVWLDVDTEHNCTVSKTRCSALDGKSWVRPGPEIASALLNWLAGGAPEAPPVGPKPTTPGRDDGSKADRDRLTWTDDERAAWEESIAKFPEHVTAVVIDDWQQSKDKPLPSAMTADVRAQFLAYLQSAKGLEAITAYTKSLESK